MTKVASQLAMPNLPFSDLAKQKTYTLVVGRIEPEHSSKDLLCLFEPAKAPQTKAVAVHTPKEWAVVYVSPVQHAVEAVTEGELSDPNPDLIVMDGLLGRMIEDKVAQVGVGIQTPQIRNKDAHELAMCPQVVTSLPQFSGFEDGVHIGVVRVFTGKHLLHLILGFRPRLMIGLAHFSIGSSGSPQ
jgi:hypothetical protein